MTNAPENRSRQPATRRTALAVGGLMASSALATGIFAWLTIRGRRSHDLKPGPTDPMLGHVGSQTVYACCLAGARAQVPGTPWAVDNADPGDGPWCLLVESGGETNLASGPSSRPPEDSPPLARLAASRLPPHVLFWMVSAGNLPETPKRWAAIGFPGSEKPEWTAPFAKFPWLAWIEGQPGDWSGRMVVRASGEQAARNLDAIASGGGHAGMRRQRDGSDLLLGWVVKPV